MSRFLFPICAAAAAAAALALSACASDPARPGPGKRDADKRALYEAHAGAPVDKFRFFGEINGWTSLGDAAIAVWTKPSEAWLLDLSGPCQGIDYAFAIGLTSQFGQVSRGFDKVLVHDRSQVDIPCRIAKIRPLDVKAIEQAERSAREAQKAPAQPSGT